MDGFALMFSILVYALGSGGSKSLLFLLAVPVLFFPLDTSFAFCCKVLEK